jgi:hypothetical protein
VSGVGARRHRRRPRALERVAAAMLRAELIERGLDAVGYVTVIDAIDALPEPWPDVVVVELRGQPMRLVERLPRLGVPVIVIGGAVELSELPHGEWIVMQRPVSIAEIADRVASA